MFKDENLFYVGGVVRDELIGASSIDTDFCYEGNAIEFAKNKGYNIVKINPDFGTVRIENGGKEIDIASTRTEKYPRPGHLPKVKNIGCSLKEDLIRRDFTINAMAKRTINDEIIDYYNGLEDINNKLLRVLHKKSFYDDPTRIIRALKFSIRFGFELEEETKLLQQDYLQNINYDMSYYRLKKELVDTFNMNNPQAYNIFVNQGIYKLLGYKMDLPDISGEDIKKIINESNISSNLWLIYIAPFINISTTKLPLTRIERRILEHAEKLKTQRTTNNTPKESIAIARLVGYV